MNNKVILMGQSHYHGLNLARAFASRGIKPYGIIIGSHDNRFLEASASWEKVYQADNEQEALRLLLQYFGEEPLKPVVIPWSDGILDVLDSSRSITEDRFITASIGKKQGRISQLMDKACQAAWAQETGLKTNPSCILSIPLKEEEIIEAEKACAYPMFLKPVSSCEGGKEDMKIIESRGELVQHIEKLERRGFHRILAQKYLRIRAEYDFMGYCCPGSNAYSVARKLRIWPPKGGAASFGKIIDAGDRREYFEGIIRKLTDCGYEGPFDIDVFLVGDDLYFNEINWRSSANVFAAVSTGNNYPYMWYCAVTGRPVEAFEPYKGPDCFFMNEFRDFRNVVHKTITFSQWKRDLRRVSAFAFRDKTDPRPFWVNLSAMFRDRFSHRKKEK